MSIQQIVTDQTSLDYEQITQLDGVEYLLRFLWSDRESCWYLDISDQDANPLASHIKIVVDWSLLTRRTDPRLPQGVLIASDMTGKGIDVQTPDELGGRVQLFYITADDALLQVAA